MALDESLPTSRLVPSDETVARINAMTPADLAEHVVAALEARGGEAQRKDIIDHAVDLGGWSAEERAVVSCYTGAARHFHLRTLADYAVTVCRDRGQIEPGAARGRWRLVATAGEVTRIPSAASSPRRSASPATQSAMSGAPTSTPSSMGTSGSAESRESSGAATTSSLSASTATGRYWASSGAVGR